jgi:hypothetical protein
MEQPRADALKVLIATEANRHHLHELLGLEFDFELPTNLTDLLDALDEAQEAALGGPDHY